MLKLLRKKGVMKKIIWFVAVIIILSFGVFGTAYLIAGNNAPNSNPYAGKIFGKKISFEEYQKNFQDVRVQNIIRYGDKYNEARAYLNFEQETWDRVIALTEADRLGIKVRNDEVIKTIQNYKFFQRNNQFDTPLYNDVVRYVFEMKPRAFEESVRKTLKISKLIAQTTQDTQITEEEVFDLFKQQNEKLQISYLHFKAEDFKKLATTTNEQVLEYYTKNKLEFLSPFSINVDYITLELPEETTPEQPSSNTAIIEEANKIYEQALASGNLTTTAAAHKLEVKSSGFFSREDPNLDLGWSFDVYNQIFQLETGEIMPPVQSSNNIIILKLTETREAYVPELEEVKNKVTDKVLRLNARTIAKKSSEDALAAIEQAYTKTADFKQAAESLGYTSQQTPEFTRGQYLPKIGISPSFQEAAFRLSETNKISGVIDTETGYYILYLDNYTAADPEQFVNVKDELSQKILSQKRNEAFTKYLNSLRQKADLEDLISRQKDEQE